MQYPVYGFCLWMCTLRTVQWRRCSSLHYIFICVCFYLFICSFIHSFIFLTHSWRVHTSNPFRSSVLLLSLFWYAHYDNFIVLIGNFRFSKLKVTNYQKKHTNLSNSLNTNKTFFVVQAMVSRTLTVISCRHCSPNFSVVMAIDFSLEKI